MGDTINEVLPFLDQYLHVFLSALEIFSNWTKSIFKLMHIVGNILTRIGTEGFCKPPEVEEGGASDSKGNWKQPMVLGWGKVPVRITSVTR